MEAIVYVWRLFFICFDLADDLLFSYQVLAFAQSLRGKLNLTTTKITFHGKIRPIALNFVLGNIRKLGLQVQAPLNNTIWDKEKNLLLVASVEVDSFIC